MRMPAVGDYGLRVLSPTLLELELVTTKPQGTTPVTTWNFVSNNSFSAPSTSEFTVTAGNKTVGVQSIGFRRRVLYAPLNYYDLRIGNYLYLQLASPIADGQTVQVTNPSGNLWGSNVKFAATTDPLRFNPAIHVNQEGYMPNFAKQAMISYYLGNLGEMTIPAGSGFSLVEAGTGKTVFSGALTLRKDVGYTYSPAPYQQVLQADFSAFNTPGEYRLQVPGLGASYAFMIDPGIAALFTRTYALGLYHQRCGFDNTFPYTRFTKGACHCAPATVPDMSYTAVNNELANMTGDYAAIQAPGTPQLKDVNSSLYPFVNKGPIDLKGGHHDAGDYSKYTINVAQLVHCLVFAVDAFPGVAALDNLGLPESGDGKPDVLQEAKWEADFLVKMQDADGGFYFLVYPRNREYEADVSLVAPELGDPQVVFPKTTSVTAASVGALAEAGSSPMMKKLYPTEAANYLAAAKKGWTFLQNAIAKYGRDGSYQKITHYGNQFGHNDELAWAAAALFVATGDKSYEADLMAHFDPSDPNTVLWSWWRMFEGYGCAIRTYAFAARTGRLPASQLDPAYLAKCEQQIVWSGDDQVHWAQEDAFASSFPDANKGPRSAGWYFSVNQAFDVATAYQITNKQAYIDTLIGNMNYEAGCNPVNIGYLTGVGWKRQREIVNQYHENDRRVLPPTGIPLGSVQTGFTWLSNYGSEPANLSFPNDYSTPPYAPYDKWSDTFNTTTEFVNPQQGRSLAAVAFLMARTPLKTQPWKAVAGKIIGLPATTPAQQVVTATLSAPGMDLSKANFVWEARDQEPTPTAAFHVAAVNVGPQWVEVEACLPDGRRVFATTDFTATTATNTPPNSIESAALTPTGDMAALYHMDGNLKDATGKQGPLVLSGNAALDPSNVGWLKNRAGQSLHASDLGDQAVVTIPNSAIVAADTQTISIEAMIYINAFKAYNKGNAKIVSLNQNWNASLEFNENMYYGPRFQCGNSVDVSTPAVLDPMTKNVWHYLRIAIDKTGYTVKVDGQTVLTQASGDLANWSGNAGVTTLTLGNFDGWIDEVVVRNIRASSPASAPPPANSPLAASLTSPVTGSTYTGMSSISLAAAASASGGAITKVAFYQGSTLLGQDTAAPYTYTWKNVPAGTYSLTVKATDKAGATVTSSPVTVTVKGTVTNTPTPPVISLAAPWKSADVGGVGVPGSAKLASGLFTVGGSGADVWGTADEFQYVYQAWKGDGEIVAKVKGIQTTDPWNKAGVMFRETLDTGSPYAMAFLTSSNGVVFQDRTLPDSNSYFALGPNVAAPYWIKLVREGSTFTSFASPNGTNWTLVNSQIVPMTTNLYVGLVACSHNNTELNTCVFTNVTVQTNISSALPAPWASKDIGAVGAPGNASADSGTFTVEGSGADIWNAADGFHYAYQTLKGDASIVARVTSVANTDPWAKAGVMFRQSLDDNSANAATVLTPSAMVFQWRGAAGSESDCVLGAATPAPYWVKLSRAGNVFTSYVSANGVTWTALGSETVTMADPVYVGLICTSHNNSELGAGTFTDVKVTGQASTNQPPTSTTPTPSNWTSTDVGSPSAAGAFKTASGTYTLTSSGFDIWGTSDQFQFAQQKWTGNGTIVARVTSLQNTDPWAKAGVMFRETLDAGSAQAMTVVSPISGTAFQRRTTSNNYSLHTPGSNLQPPCWVKLTRAGNVFTSYVSSDGTAWTLVGSETIPMASAIYVGMIDSSHAQGVSNTATFTDVKVGAN